MFDFLAWFKKSKLLALEREKNLALTAELIELRKNAALLAPRELFENRLDLVLSQSKRYQLPCAIIMMAIDEFNVVNDVLGYDVGEALLKEMETRLRAMIRQADTLSRFSEDCFAILLPQTAKGETIVYVVQRLLEAVTQPFRVQGEDLFVTASMGIAVCPEDGDEAKTLLKNADIALNQAKLRGRNTYQFYQKEMHALSQRELMLSSKLRNPTVYENIKLRFQPYIEVTTQQTLGMETLIEWQDPEFGLISTADFFHFAEKSGKILEISVWLLQRILAEFKAFNESGLSLQMISMPMHARQLQSSHFIYKISQLLQETHVSPKHLMFEVPENALPAKMEVLEKSFNMLKHLGVNITLSHCGMGYLSLQQIKKLSIDYLKLDPLLGPNPENQQTLEMIQAIAKSLHLTVIATGVRSEVQKEFLTKMGFKIMQGELFGPLLSSCSSAREALT